MDFNETRKMTANFRAILAALSHRADRAGGYLQRSLNEIAKVGRKKREDVSLRRLMHLHLFLTSGFILI